jgi:hypothetical protein
MSKILVALLLGAAILFPSVAAFADGGDAGNAGNRPAVDKYVPGDQQLRLTPEQSGQ